MRFRLVGGYLGNRPPEEARWSGYYRALITGDLPAGADRTFRSFLKDHDATVVVVAPGTKPSLRRLVRTLPFSPTRNADVLVYRLTS